MGDFRRRLWAARPTALREKPGAPPEASEIPPRTRAKETLLKAEEEEKANEKRLKSKSKSLIGS